MSFFDILSITWVHHYNVTVSELQHLRQNRAHPIKTCFTFKHLK